jgi:hypothetical protein
MQPAGLRLQYSEVDESGMFGLFILVDIDPETLAQ